MQKIRSKKEVRKRRVSFTLKAPEAGEVTLAGDFNSWDRRKHTMKKNVDGVWSKTLVLPPGRYEYKYLIDGRWHENQPEKDTCYNCFGSQNRVIVVSAPKS
jgi:1,4-alpha-glucan branching enzyme